MRFTNSALLVALIVCLAPAANAQVVLEVGSRGNLVTILVENSHPRLPLQASVRVDGLPLELTMPGSELEYLVPTVAWPGEVARCSFVFDVDPAAAPGPVPDVEFTLSRSATDSVTLSLPIEIVPAAPLGADVRVEFRIDIASADLDPSASLAAVVDDLFAVPLADDGLGVDAVAGDGIASGFWIATAGTSRWHRYVVEIDGVAECEPIQTFEQRSFVVEDGLFDAGGNPQILPVARLEVCTVVAVSPASSTVSLSPNRPNPFQGGTRVAWVQDRSARVSLEVYDSRGRRVARPVAERNYGPGDHQLEWRATDRRGQRLGAGVYRLVLRIDGVRADVRSILVVK